MQSQYLRDLSFELVREPWKKQFVESDARLDNNISVSTKAFDSKDNFEVSVKLNIKLLESDEVLFGLDLEYSGVFFLKGVEEKFLQRILMVDCAYLLFPFIRNIVASVTQDSGFRTLSLNPINFQDLYQKFLLNEGKSNSTT